MRCVEIEAVAKASGSARVGEQAKRPRFWVGPLLAGGCFALGYGITQRFIVLQGALQEPRREAFASEAFPGEGLEALRRRHGEFSRDLTADVAAKEAELAREREAEKSRQEAERIAAEANRHAEQQALLPTVVPEPVLPEPAWTQPEQAIPAPVIPKPEPKPQPVAAEPAPARPPRPAPVLAEPAPVAAPFPAPPVAPPSP